jgi:hypothetical protein
MLRAVSLVDKATVGRVERRGDGAMSAEDHRLGAGLLCVEGRVIDDWSGCNIHDDPTVQQL